MGMLDGKVAIVTGAGNGVGRGEAIMLADHGARVVVNDLGGSVSGEGADKRAADEVVEVINKRGGEAVANYDSVADFDGAKNIIGTAIDAFGRLDVLVNNAGILTTNRIENQTLEGFEAIVRVNLYGVFNGMRSVIAPMRAAGGGSIVNISSAAGLRGVPGYGAYGATKWAVRGITKTAALELASDRIRVNSIHPGAVDTPMVAASNLQRGEGGLPSAPLGRVGIPEDIANLVLFLSSDASSYITGAEFAIDGGGFQG
jgi:3alpha(or 20beta)-hydroxysteroid dehydrogenase